MTDMLITNESAVRRLKASEEGILHKFIGKGSHGNGGRLKSKENIPIEIRGLIAATAAFDTQDNVAKEFGTTQANVSEIVNGNNGGEKVKKIAESHVEKIHAKALDRVMKSLDLISDEMLESLDSPTKLATVAKDISLIIDKTTPKIEGGDNVKVVIFAPRQRSEKDYEVIDIK